MKCLYYFVFVVASYSKRLLLRMFVYISDYKAVFTHICNRNLWHGKESVSGTGSDTVHTIVIRNKLPNILKQYKVSSVLDAACGDFNWMKKVNLPLDMYIGVDIVQQIIENNNQLYAHEKQRFMNLDISKDRLPRTDFILCRDCLVHYPYSIIFNILKNLKQSGATYLFTTTFPQKKCNVDIYHAGYEWRPLNLEMAPFNFPKPILIINEEYKTIPAFVDKSMGLWKFSDLHL